MNRQYKWLILALCMNLIVMVLTIIMLSTGLVVEMNPTSRFIFKSNIMYNLWY